MKYFSYGALLFFISIINFLIIGKPIEFVVVVPSFNNEKYCKANLDSILKQKYPYFEVFYVNDCSTDRTENIVDIYQEKNKSVKNLKVIHNKKRQGALKNLYTVISQLAPYKVVVTVDGDDALAHPNVLSRLAQIYSDDQIWLTYGQYKCYPIDERSYCAEYPEGIIKQNGFRRYPWLASHLRTFYAGLFQKIKKEDLIYEKQFYPVAWDLSIMFPMLEMASKNHFKFIPEILYIYNNGNPINDHKKDVKLITKLTEQIRSKRRYEPLKNLDFMD